jgi:N-acetylmuramoyl-L-alanine amidase
VKVAIWLGVFSGLLAGFAVHSSPSKLSRISLEGVPYVQLEDWARVSNFRLQWIAPKQEVKLSSGSSTLIFTVDSARCSLNGINVWLSFPIALRNGSACIAATDLTTALQPALFPSQNPRGATVTTICLDPGHGGKDPGNREGKQQEKKYTLLLAEELRSVLSKAGFKVNLTRANDTFVELPSRPEIARRRSADLFVSLHFNSADGAGASAVKGTEIYCMTPARVSSTNSRGEGAGTGSFPGNRFDSRNVLLAYQIQKALVKNLGVEDRGLRRARFAVLRWAEMPAVLIEGGFMTNPTEARKIYDPAYRRQMAQAIADGVLAYKKLVEQ